MSGRAPSAPPALGGYTPVELIGSGGYADVFLYEQHMPNRKVAVKVLVGDAISGEAQRRQFAAEANLMARVSTHPYIVSIFQAEVAPDGRPYLVMEYYPGDNYLRRARREQFSIAEVLRVGVQVGSAVETAHRAGILHRDIKPANILTSEFRRPGLTDFGIASASGPEADETEGVSIPWSLPEAFGASELDARADVYSLAATLFHLLAGRSPFEVPGGDNGALALMSRIERDRVPPLGRSDAPASLERVLVQAMAKDPSHRPASAAEFVRQLQAVEAEMKLSVTPLEVADDGSSVRVRTEVEDDDATRIKGVTEIRPQAAAIDSIPANPVGAPPVAPRRREGLLAEPEVADTVHRPAAPAAARTGEPAEPQRSRALLLGLGGIVVAAIVVGGTLIAIGGSSEPSDTTAVFGNGTGPAFVEAVSPVEEVVGTAGPDGSVMFTWSAPGRAPGDVYEVEVLSGAPIGSAAVSATEYTVTRLTGGEVCIKVTATRQSSEPAPSPKACVTP